MRHCKQSPHPTGTGIALGVVLGFVLLNLAAALVAFLASIVAFGQMDYWLAGVIGRVGG